MGALILFGTLYVGFLLLKINATKEKFKDLKIDLHTQIITKCNKILQNCLIYLFIWWFNGRRDIWVTYDTHTKLS